MKIERQLQKMLQVLIPIEVQYWDKADSEIIVEKEKLTFRFPRQFQLLPCFVFKKHILISVDHYGEEDEAKRKAAEADVDLFRIHAWRITELRNHIDALTNLVLRKYPDPFLKRKAVSKTTVNRATGMRMFLAVHKSHMALSATSPFAAIYSVKKQGEKQ